MVLDSSAILATMFHDERTPVVLAVRNTAAQEGARVPAIWHLEVVNTLVLAVRRKRITALERDGMLHDLEALPIAVDDETAAHAWKSSMRLAEQHRLTAYDAAYLELALRLDLPLASLDTDLNAAAVRCGVEALLA